MDNYKRLETAKVDNSNFNLYISISLELVVVLTQCTFLHFHSGIVIVSVLLSLGMILYYLRGNQGGYIKKSTACLTGLTIIGYLLYLMFSTDVFASKQWKMGITMVLTVLILYNAAPYCEANTYYVSNLKNKLIDFLYFIMYAFCLFEVIRFGYTVYTDGVWALRMWPRYGTFPFRYIHSTYAVFIILVFMLGIKRGYLKLSIILGIVSAVIMPSRMILLFLSLYIICHAFKKPIYIIFEKTVKSSFFWILILLTLTIIFCYIWVVALSGSHNILEPHAGLYDTSNMQRFKSIMYGLQVILEKKLIFGGIDSAQPGYSGIIDSIYSETAGPHNSMVSLLLNFSIFLGGVYLFFICKIIDKFLNQEMVSLVVPFIIVSSLYPDNFVIYWGIHFLLVLYVPFGKSYNQNNKMFRYKLPKIKF